MGARRTLEGCAVLLGAVVLLNVSLCRPLSVLAKDLGAAPTTLNTVTVTPNWERKAPSQVGTVTIIPKPGAESSRPSWLLPVHIGPSFKDGCNDFTIEIVSDAMNAPVFHSDTHVETTTVEPGDPAPPETVLNGSRSNGQVLRFWKGNDNAPSWEPSTTIVVHIAFVTRPGSIVTIRIKPTWKCGVVTEPGAVQPKPPDWHPRGKCTSCHSPSQCTVPESALPSVDVDCWWCHGPLLSASVSIPEGAVGADTLLYIGEQPLPEPPSPYAVPPGIARIAVAHEFGPDGITFDEPATISLPYRHEQIDGLREESLGIFLYDPGEQEWREVSGATLDTVANELTFQTTHFSIYGIGGAAEAVPTPSSSRWSLALLAVVALGLAARRVRTMRSTPD